MILGFFCFSRFFIGLCPVSVLVIMGFLIRPRAVADQLFQFLAFFFGVRWSTRLQFVQLCGWFCWYALLCWRAVISLSTRLECRLDCLIAHTLFLLLTSAHVIILLDAFLQRHKCCPLSVLAEDCAASQHVGLCIWSVLVPNLLVHIVFCLFRIRLAHVASMPLFWVATPSSFGLQMKLYTFLTDILVANVRVVAVRESVKQLARKPQIFPPRRQEADVEPIKLIKQRYSELSQLFTRINLNYGNSLLIIFIALFLNFVFNSYWLVKNILTKTIYREMVYIHLAVVSCLGALFATICWHCQQSYNHVSSYIFIKKLLHIFLFTESTNRLFDLQTGETVGWQAL